MYNESCRTSRLQSCVVWVLINGHAHKKKQSTTNLHGVEREVHVEEDSEIVRELLGLGQEEEDIHRERGVLVHQFRQSGGRQWQIL